MTVITGIFTRGADGTATAELSGGSAFRSEAVQAVASGYLANRDELGAAEGISDAELLWTLYRNDDGGARALARVEGQFAAAFFAEGKLILARDGFGAEQLYYANTGTDAEPSISFSSTLPPLLERLREAGLEPQANEDTIYRYLRYGAAAAAGETFFADVQTPAPGTVITLAIGPVADGGSLTTGTEPAAGTAVPAVPEANRPEPAAALGGTAGLLGTGAQRLLARDSGELSVHSFGAELKDFAAAAGEPVATSAYYRDFKQLGGLAGTDPAAVLAGYGAEALLAQFPAETGAASGAASGVASGVSALLSKVPAAGKIAGKAAALLPIRRSVAAADLLGRPFLGDHRGTVLAPQPEDPAARASANLENGEFAAARRRAASLASHFGLQARSLLAHPAPLQALLGAPAGTLVAELEALRPRPLPEGSWFKELRVEIYKIFMSNSFAKRRYWNREAVLTAFEEFLDDKNRIDTRIFWRLINLELWFRAFIDGPEEQDGILDKSDYVANPGKPLDLAVDVTEGSGLFRRYPLQTGVFHKDTELDPAVVGYVKRFFDGLPDAGAEHLAATAGTPWYLFVSEKIVAITQGRSFPVWDIKVTPAARLFSRFVKRTPAGIGLGSPWSMQIAIDEVGLPLIAKASAASVIGKLRGKSGVFYEVVGHDINAIDGATSYTLGASSHSVKLAPKDPAGVAARISALVRQSVPAEYAASFGGTAIMDTNDLGSVAMGTDIDAPKAVLEAIFKDNPQGQGNQATPMSLIFKQA